MVWVGLEASGSAAPDQVQAAVQIAEAVRGAVKAGQPIMLATFQASAPR